MQSVRGGESVQPVRRVQSLRRERVQPVQPVQSVCGFGVQSLQSLRGDVELGVPHQSVRRVTPPSPVPPSEAAFAPTGVRAALI